MPVRLGMIADDIKARFMTFALDVMRFAKSCVPDTDINRELACQVTRAASAAGAGYRAACRARSRTDFVYKLGHAIEEVDEAAYWLELLQKAGITTAEDTRPLSQEADELTRILVRSRETAQRRR